MKKDNTYMNDKQLDKLAEKLLDKLLERCSQPEWHVRRSDDFVNNLSGLPTNIHLKHCTSSISKSQDSVL